MTRLGENYLPGVPWHVPIDPKIARPGLRALGWKALDHIPRIPEDTDTSMAAFWFRSGHKDDLMQREIWGGYRRLSK